MSSDFSPLKALLSLPGLSEGIGESETSLEDLTEKRMRLAAKKERLEERMAELDAAIAEKEQEKPKMGIMMVISTSRPLAKAEDSFKPDFKVFEKMIFGSPFEGLEEASLDSPAEEIVESPEMEGVVDDCEEVVESPYEEHVEYPFEEVAMSPSEEQAEEAFEHFLEESNGDFFPEPEVKLHEGRMLSEKKHKKEKKEKLEKKSKHEKEEHEAPKAEKKAKKLSKSEKSETSISKSGISRKEFAAMKNEVEKTHLEVEKITKNLSRVGKDLKKALKSNEELRAKKKDESEEKIPSFATPTKKRSRDSFIDSISDAGAEDDSRLKKLKHI